VIGVLRRFADGRKSYMPGGHRGLYLPSDLSLTDGLVYVPEGASDVAALLSHGVHAVGRPFCTGGIQHLCTLFAGKRAQVMVVGENDQKEDGRWPGRDGAMMIAGKLAEHGIHAAWTLPPNEFKDVRAWLTTEEHNDAE
jgi:hypothetical protein